jgi:hypothetical protein
LDPGSRKDKFGSGIKSQIRNTAAKIQDLIWNSVEMWRYPYLVPVRCHGAVTMVGVCAGRGPGTPIPGIHAVRRHNAYTAPRVALWNKNSSTFFKDIINA